MRAVPFSRFAAFAALAAAGLTADLATKSWIFRRLGLPQHGADNVLWVWEPYFGFQTSMNRGALFGLGQGMVWVFATAACVAIGGILYWLFIAGAARSWLLAISLGLVMGGVLGNLYDRLGLWDVPNAPETRIHAVRDWILCQWPPWVWPNFNIADSLLVCGGALFAWHTIRQAPSASSKAAQHGASEKAESSPH